MYNLETENGSKIIAKYVLTQSEPDISIGDELYATLASDHLLIYSYPNEGLEAELALE